MTTTVPNVRLLAQCGVFRRERGDLLEQPDDQLSRREIARHILRPEFEVASLPNLSEFVNLYRGAQARIPDNGSSFIPALDYRSFVGFALAPEFLKLQQHA